MIVKKQRIKDEGKKNRKHIPLPTKLFSKFRLEKFHQLSKQKDLLLGLKQDCTIVSLHANSTTMYKQKNVINT